MHSSPNGCGASACSWEIIRKSLRDLSSLAHVQEARTSLARGWARITRDMNDQKVVAAYARVGGTGWLVFVGLPIGGGHHV